MISQSLLPELEQEARNTRKMLERVPFEKASWKPHEKSMTLGRLANHIADLVNWLPFTISTTEMDIMDTNYKSLNAENREDLLRGFDENVKRAVQALTSATDKLMMEPWTLRRGDQVIFTMPKVAVIRSMVMNHIIHHRAQLSVFLRLLGEPVPGMYGPSADEKLKG